MDIGARAITKNTETENAGEQREQGRGQFTFMDTLNGAIYHKHVLHKKRNKKLVRGDLLLCFPSHTPGYLSREMQRQGTQ